ncbi:uncharacterized protein LOC120326506 [Styela clava]|uniref:uncharacterized protein LOC120326506 n=1 Tax=Styela clava TaxID=7725 RepID=UPI00193A6131|nr:uncharacterized protein LOC120326506 [Styela clava]
MESFEQRRARRNSHVEVRSNTLWDMFEPEWVAHLLGISLNGLSGEEAKLMLRNKKVWPFYYYTPNDLNDWDRFPTELLPENIRKDDENNSELDHHHEALTKHLNPKLSFFQNVKNKISKKRLR